MTPGQGDSQRRARMSGVLLVDKPAGITSADLTNQLKKKFRFERIGHGGTLDPFATGLMVVLVGEATKIARFLLEGDKEYEAEASLGTETDTGDLTGEVVNKCEVPALSLEEWRGFARNWTGTIRQTPPAYSAIKVKGKPLYEYARQGEEVEVPTREVSIKELEVRELTTPGFRFRVRCSGGTYVRALAADLAMSAGTCAHLNALRRTGSSAFRVENSLPLEKLLQLAPSDLPLRPLEEALAHLPQVRVNEVLALKVRQGNLAVFDALRDQIDKPGYFLVLDVSGGKALPVAVCNHHPMMRPNCTIERVFDPALQHT
jgi:tRNA pseudouridine55 synthase